MNRLEYRPEVEHLAVSHGLDANLVESIVWQESAGVPCAYRHEAGFWTKYLAGSTRWKAERSSRVSASYGLMQILYTTAVEEHGYAGDPEALCVPLIGLEYGCRHLAALFVWAKNDLRTAVAAYNGGKGNAAGLKPQAYADAVLLRLDAIRAREGVAA